MESLLEQWQSKRGDWTVARFRDRHADLKAKTDAHDAQTSPLTPSQLSKALVEMQKIDALLSACAEVGLPDDNKVVQTLLNVSTPNKKRSSPDDDVSTAAEESPASGRPLRQKKMNKRQKKALKYKAENEAKSQSAEAGDAETQSGKAESGDAETPSGDAAETPSGDASETTSSSAPKSSTPKSKTRKVKSVKKSSEDAAKSAVFISKECLKCHQMGHVVANCPLLHGDGAKIQKSICWRCGSDSHNLSNCPKGKNADDGNDLPFATCFACDKQGHVASQCPDNPNGIYPKGGSCFRCGSIYHLAVNCSMRSEKLEEKRKHRTDKRHREAEEKKVKKTSPKTERFARGDRGRSFSRGGGDRGRSFSRGGGDRGRSFSRGGSDRGRSFSRGGSDRGRSFSRGGGRSWSTSQSSKGARGGFRS